MNLSEYELEALKKTIEGRTTMSVTIKIKYLKDHEGVDEIKKITVS